MKHVAIVGAGIAGLTLANLLGRAGCLVEVYESATKLEPVGAGFTLQPNGLAVIADLGLEEAIRRDACSITRSIILTPDGQPLGVDIMSELSGDGESYAIHRADMHRHLESILGNEVTIHLGTPVTAVSHHRLGASVELATGGSKEFDLVVGADGVRSTVRRSIFPQTDVRRNQGIAVRTVIPLFEEDTMNTSFRAWMGSGMLLLTYPIRAGRELNIVSYQPHEEGIGSAWSNPYPVERLRALYEGWDPQIMQLLDRVESCFHWQLVDMDPLPNYVHSATCLVGDAAHPMLPYLGQGANQAFIDCRVLAEMLEPWVKNEASLGDSLQRYEKKRNPAATEMMLQSEDSGRIFKESFFDVASKRREVATALVKYRAK